MDNQIFVNLGEGAGQSKTATLKQPRLVLCPVKFFAREPKMICPLRLL
jgi:hypothetical protein